MAASFDQEAHVTENSHFDYIVKLQARPTNLTDNPKKKSCEICKYQYISMFITIIICKDK